MTWNYYSGEMLCFLQQDCIMQSLVALSNYCLYYTFNWFVTKVTISQLINIWHRWVYPQPINPGKLYSYVSNVTTTVCNLSYKMSHIKSTFQTLVIFLHLKVASEGLNSHLIPQSVPKNNEHQSQGFGRLRLRCLDLWFSGSVQFGGKEFKVADNVFWTLIFSFNFK